MGCLIKHKGIYPVVGARFIVPGFLPHFLTLDLLLNLFRDHIHFSNFIFISRRSKPLSGFDKKL